MKHVDYHIATAHKNKMPSSQEMLEAASFLTIEPQGEVWPKGSDAIYAVVDIPSADEWSIVAHFSSFPGWVALSFELEDRDAAFEALLHHKKSRPIYYRDDSNCFELHGTSVADLVEEIKSKDICIEAVNRAENRPWQNWGQGETRH